MQSRLNPQPPYYRCEELGWRLFPLPMEVRMAWESAGSRGEEAKPRPREIFLARKAQGKGRSWVRNRRDTRERLAERREKPRDSGCRGQGRNRQVDSAGERGRAAPVGGWSDPESRPLGILGKGPQRRPSRGLRDRTWVPGLTWSRAGRRRRRRRWPSRAAAPPPPALGRRRRWRRRSWGGGGGEEST